MRSRRMPFSCYGSKFEFNAADRIALKNPCLGRLERLWCCFAFFRDHGNPNSLSAMASDLRFCLGVVMKLRMDKTLRFWVDVAYQDLKDEHLNLTKRQLVAHILREYEGRGDAMRYLNLKGKIAWKASPSFLDTIADAERDAQHELDDP